LIWQKVIWEERLGIIPERRVPSRRVVAVQERASGRDALFADHVGRQRLVPPRVVVVREFLIEELTRLLG
jgi:hypothetical protein